MIKKNIVSNTVEFKYSFVAKISNFHQQEQLKKRLGEADQTLTSTNIQTGNNLKETRIIHLLKKTRTIE